MAEMQNNEQNNNGTPYKKPPWYVQLFLAAYGFIWMNMIFVAGLNSLYMKTIDWDSFSLWVAMTAGFPLIFKFLPKILK
ncbi:hypothetical protein [Phascolarctobacterium sp.]|uniref:hypothetical protein n=1 Tax=Phascolarctobacterium sp. TaxID=2049039 RepID=UPI003863963A